jgi:type IV pilus assembly protein PilB
VKQAAAVDGVTVTMRTPAKPPPKATINTEEVPLHGDAVRKHVPVELLGERSPSVSALSRAGFATVEQLYEAVAVQFRLPRLELDGVDLSLDLATLIPKAVAEKHHFVPVFASADEVSIASADPSQLQLFDWLARQLRRPVAVVVATPSEIERAQKRLYEPRRAHAIDEAAEDVSQEALAAASQVVNGIVAGAIEQKASDIHIEATERETIVRYRVDGALRQVETRPIELHAAIVSRIKVLAQLDISIRHAPQDGRIKLPSAAGDIDLRVSVLPTYWGEKVVCRLLDNRRAALPLEAIGFEPAHREEFLKLVRAPYGLVLVTGPTGSGKSTTLYAALNAVRDPEVNVVTVEDPVEYQIPGINQVQVAPKRGLTFASALRSILRQDPDVILVGEIRDQETGQLAAEAALTGHLVLSSLHTNDAPSSITRLTELGIEPYLVAPSLLGIVSQRLMRAVCKTCGELYTPEAAEVAAVGLRNVPAGTQIARGRGCSACHRTGYSGRLAVRELLTVDDEIRALIAKRATVDQLRAAAVAKGFRTMRFHALRLWLAGLTPTREVIRVTRA